MGKKVTLKDIAEATGVTTASVSMILNGKDIFRFTPELVSKVLDTARRMHYVSPAAKREQKHIAIISPSVNNPYHTTIITGIEHAAQANGYLASIYNTYWNPHTELAVLRQMDKRRFAGIIYAMNPIQIEKVLEINHHTPVVAIGDTVSDLGIDMVDINSFNAGCVVAEHLISLGHKHIAYLTTSLNSHHISRVRRCEGLRDAYRRFCPEGSVTVYCKDSQYEQEILSPDIELDSGKELAYECMKDPGITAIVSINDMVGYGVLDALLEAGCRVPEDYSLCGFDNSFPSAFRRMGLTTVDHSTVYHGAQAFHLLKEKMEDSINQDSAFPITRVEYKSKLILRGSTGVPRDRSAAHTDRSPIM